MVETSLAPPRVGPPPSVVLATHYWTVGPASALREYLQPRTTELMFVAHPLFARQGSSYHRIYREGELTRSSERLPPSGPGRYVEEVWRTIRWVAATGQRFDVFVAGDNLLAMAGLWLRARRQVGKVILYTIDFVPKRFRNPVLNHLYHRADAFAVRHSNLVWNAARGVERARRERDRAGGGRTPQLTVPIGAHFSRIERLPIDQEPSNQIVFLGHVLDRQGIQVVIQALPRIREVIHDARFLVIGDGPYLPELKKLAESIGVSQAVEFAGSSDDHSQIEKRLAESAIGVAPYVPDARSLTQYTDLPGKIKNYLASGLPVILTAVPGDAWEVEAAGAGRVVDYSVNAIAGAAISYLSDRSRLRQAREAATRMAEAFDWDRIFDLAWRDSAPYVYQDNFPCTPEVAATPDRQGLVRGPLLSIVIPVLNAAQDLPTCLNAIRKQSIDRHLVEVIAVDGGSTDDTQAIATAAGARLLTNPLRRAEPGVAIGIRAARGSIVTVLAADNWMRGSDFIDRILEPFADPEIAAAFPRVVSTDADSLPNRYVNRYTDPFTHFVYGSAGTSFDVLLEQSERPSGARYGTLTASVERHPLLAVAQGCTVRRRFYRQSPELADDVLPIVDIIRSGGKIALVDGAELEHHHVAGLKSFYQKYRYRARIGLQAQQGILRRRSALSLGRQLRTSIWLPYSAALVPPVVHGLVMSIRRRDPLLLYHPVLNTVLLAAVCREIAALGFQNITTVRARGRVAS